jgi:hypothetical protein
MHSSDTAHRSSNLTLARTIACAVEGAGKPRHQIAREAGMHRVTLIRVMRGERPIGFDEAESILNACGVFSRAAMILALIGEEDLAKEWMRSEAGEFLEELFASLPSQLDRTLGRKLSDLRPRWANGTSQMVARTLAKHIDEFANRDFAMSAGR